MKTTDRVRYIREAGRIERCHQWPKTTPYRNGQHTFGVVVILRLLWPDRLDLVDYALFHDTPELTTGDIPSPAINKLGISETLRQTDMEVTDKLGVPSEHDLPENDWCILRAADSLDLWLWCWDEEAMGNLSAKAMRESMDVSFSKRNASGLLPDEAWEFINEFREDGWKRMGGLV